MKVSDFDFELPEDRIALRPASPRDSARLLCVQPGAHPGAHPEMSDHLVRDLPGLLAPGDVLVVNNTRVIPARLRGVRPADDSRGEARIEATLHLRKSPESWLAFTRPAKRLRIGDEIGFHDELSARVAEKGDGGEVLLDFNKSGQDLDIEVIS